jgi:hypothetical protein
MVDCGVMEAAAGGIATRGFTGEVVVGDLTLVACTSGGCRLEIGDTAD